MTDEEFEKFISVPISKPKNVNFDDDIDNSDYDDNTENTSNHDHYHHKNERQEFGNGKDEEVYEGPAGAIPRYSKNNHNISMPGDFHDRNTHGAQRTSLYRESQNGSQ